jgi:hypothetical protein
MDTMIATQAKVVSYHNWHPKDDFIPLVIKNLDVNTIRQTTSFINVPTWHGQQRALNVHLIGKEC